MYIRVSSDEKGCRFDSGIYNLPISGRRAWQHVLLNSSVDGNSFRPSARFWAYGISRFDSCKARRRLEKTMSESLCVNMSVCTMSKVGPPVQRRVQVRILSVLRIHVPTPVCTALEL